MRWRSRIHKHSPPAEGMDMVDCMVQVCDDGGLVGEWSGKREAEGKRERKSG